MKTLTTTLSIFALLLSSTAFSLDLNEDIQPPIRNDRPGIEVNTNNNLNEDIQPPIRNDRPGFNL
jgi:hypothetical protein